MVKMGKTFLERPNLFSEISQMIIITPVNHLLQVMGVQFWLSDGTGEFQMRLERDGGDVDLNVSNPYVDTSLTPATAYNYTGRLFSQKFEYTAAYARGGPVCDQ